MTQITYDPDYIVPFCEQEPEVVYADPHILVVEKPSGLLSTPGRDPRNRDCLITRLQTQWPTAQLVHRLDMDTSGLMVVALTARAQAELSRQFRERLVAKTYRAAVFGHMAADEGEIDFPLIADWPNRPLQKVCYQDGKPSLTYYSVLQRLSQPDISLVELRPHTGRSHQLRLHLKALGYPILGDKFYADPHICTLAKRLMLHACHLQFSHPESGDTLSYSSAFNLTDLLDCT